MVARSTAAASPLKFELHASMVALIGYDPDKQIIE